MLIFSPTGNTDDAFMSFDKVDAARSWEYDDWKQHVKILSTDFMLNMTNANSTCMLIIKVHLSVIILFIHLSKKERGTTKKQKKCSSSLGFAESTNKSLNSLLLQIHFSLNFTYRSSFQQILALA